MPRWYAGRERKPRGRQLIALTLTLATLAVAQIAGGDPAGLAAHHRATPESQPPLLMYDVRRALEQMSRQG
jgi:hypothetical protein